MARRFFDLDAPTPAVRPAFLVVTSRGAWEAYDAADAIQLERSLRHNGIVARMMKAV